MTKFIHNPALILPMESRSSSETCAPDKKRFEVELTIVRVDGRYKWWYSNPLIVVRDMQIDVYLNLNFMSRDPAWAEISSYASSGVSSGKKPIFNFNTEKNNQSASFKLNLEEHEMIDFGIFVTVHDQNKNPDILFCDPQASNDPIKTKINT